MKKLTTLFLIICLIISSVAVFKVSAYSLNNLENTITLGNGKIYYVDSALGNDENDGLSEDTAWASLIKVNSFQFNAGDSVLLKRDSVFTNQHLYVKGKGEKGNPITVSTYGEGEKPQILAFNSEDIVGFEAGIVDTAVYFKNSDYVTIDNLYIQNCTPSTGEQYSIYVGWEGKGGSPRIDGTRIQNCTIYGSSPDYWSSTSHKSLDGILVNAYIESVFIENNEIYNCKGNGITVNGFISGCDYLGKINPLSATGVEIRGNFLSNIGADGIMVNNCVKPLVEYNTVAKSHSYSTAAEVAFWPFATYGALFQYNEAYNTQTTSDGQGFDCDYCCYDTCFQYNYSHNNSGGFMLICTEASASWLKPTYAYNNNSVVRYNVSENDLHYTFTFTGAVENTKIYNNTIYTKWGLDTNGKIIFTYAKGANQLSGLTYPNNSLFANNILYTQNFKNFDWGGENTWTNIEWKNNLVYTSSNNAPANNKVNNSEDKGKYICSKCSNKELLSDYEVVDADEQTYTCPNCHEECTISEVVISNFTTSGNIYSTEPLLVNPGTAGIGIENCSGYKLYSNSPCIASGLFVDESEMLYKTNSDFFGNSIPQTPNIGAYQGTGEGEYSPQLLDNRYNMLIDFENSSLSATSTKVQGATGGSTWNSTLGIYSTVKSDKYDSTQSAKITSTKTTADSIKWQFFVGYKKFTNAYGVSFYANGNGSSFTAYAMLGSYKCYFSVPANGGIVNLRFDTDTWKNSNGATVEVDQTSFANANSIEIGAASFPASGALYIDNICSDLFTPSQMPTTTIPTTTIQVNAKSYPEIRGYEINKVIDTYDTYDGTKKSDYCTYGVGDSSSGDAFNFKSLSMYKSSDNCWVARWFSSNGDAIRFWYKCGASGYMQFRKSSTVVYSVTLPASSGSWYTVDYAKNNIEPGSFDSICIKQGSTIYFDELHTLNKIMLGDVDGNSEINSVDVLKLKQYLSGYDENVSITYCDLNNDGNIGIKDILLLKKYLANLITTFD